MFFISDMTVREGSEWVWGLKWWRIFLCVGAFDFL